MKSTSQYMRGAAACSMLFFVGSCSDLFMKEPNVCAYTTVAESEIPVVTMPDETASDTINDDYNDCLRTEYYFCPGISGPLMRVEVVKDICKDPPVVLSMSECQEFLECDPSVGVVDEEPCVTMSGYPGTRIIHCVKGFLKPGPCVGVCNSNLCEDIEVFSEVGQQDVAEDNEVSEEDAVTLDTCDEVPTDILFLVDMSASMYSEINEVVDSINFFSSQYKDEDIQWAMIAGPLNAGQVPGNNNYLAIISDLQDAVLFKNEAQKILTFSLSSQYEMLYDALYLSIHNLSLFLPYENDNLSWPTWIGKVFSESVPPIEDFKISWRNNSKKAIIIVTNEIGQSFLFPDSQKGKSYNTKNTITKSKLTLMLQTINDLKVYTFTDIGSKTGEQGWAYFSEITSGKWYDLHDGNISFNLSEVVEDAGCF